MRNQNMTMVWGVLSLLLLALGVDASPVRSYNTTLTSSHGGNRTTAYHRHHHHQNHQNHAHKNQTHTHPLLARAPDLQGTCPHRHLPTEPTYRAALDSFCNTNIPTQGLNIAQDKPLVITIFLTAYDSRPISWVFSISVRNNKTGWGRVTRELCHYKFESMLTSDYAGGLGKAYCVMGGTGGDKVGNEGMSGEGVVGMLEGKVTDPQVQGKKDQFTWEMRQRADDKHGE